MTEIAQPAANRVSLTQIIELGVQKTYHDLTVLAELLPRKTDFERKVEIVNFAEKTRQLFIRLLALVRWAGGASKLEQCMDIVSFLDKQALLFINTADNMANIARTTLVQAFGKVPRLSPGKYRFTKFFNLRILPGRVKTG